MRAAPARCTAGSPFDKLRVTVRGGDFTYAESRAVRQHDLAVRVRDPGERIAGGEEGPVEIGPVDQRAQVGSGGGEDLRLDHAAEHDLEPQRARGVDHRQRAADPAAFRELDVEPVDAAVQGGEIARVLRVLVGDDRDRRTLANPAQLLGRAGRDRLLAELDLELRHLGEELDRLFGRPALVRVDTNRAVVDGTDRLDRLDLRALAELDFNDRVRPDLAHLRERLGERGDPDRA